MHGQDSFNNTYPIYHICVEGSQYTTYQHNGMSFLKIKTYPIVGAAERTCARSPLPQYEEVEIAFHKWLQMQEPDF